ncbi:hypothetical protein Fmac_003703 [Flemingia macrophylla]|uniref:HTH myb-type domain-containing protein n=1 Tax=Flemingia macrophylla TaxID=520843 RepID=A0ABD1N2V0_9FABA
MAEGSWDKFDDASLCAAFVAAAIYPSKHWLAEYRLGPHSSTRKIIGNVMSVDGSQSSVMKAVSNGACDYWIKPLNVGRLQNMWTHAFRKAIKNGHSKKRENDNSEFGSTVIDARGGVVSSSRESGEVGESNYSCQPPAKKPRVIWTLDLHRQFVKAVGQIGEDKAVPKKILEVMNIPGLTRENVASHLQKYRTFLKDSSDGAKQQNEMERLNSIQGTKESSVGVPVRVESITAPSHVSNLASLNLPPSHVSYNTQAILNPATSHVNTQAILNPATSHVSDNIFATLNLPPSHFSNNLLSALNLGPTPTIQLPNQFHPEQGVTHIGDPSNITIANNFLQSIMDPSINGVWLPVDIQKGNVLMDTFQQKQQRQQTMMHQQIGPSNLQPSSMMISGNPSFVTQNINYGLLSPHTINSLGASQIHGANIPGSTSGAVRYFPAPESDGLVPYGSRSGDLIYQEYTSIPPQSVEDTSFAIGSSGPNFSKDIVDNNTTKDEEEPN